MPFYTLRFDRLRGHANKNAPGDGCVPDDDSTCADNTAARYGDPPQHLCAYADVNAVTYEGAVISNAVVSYAVVTMKLDALAEHGGGVDHNRTVVNQINALANVITRHLKSKFVTK